MLIHLLIKRKRFVLGPEFNIWCKFTRRRNPLKIYTIFVYLRWLSSTLVILIFIGSGFEVLNILPVQQRLHKKLCLLFLKMGYFWQIFRRVKIYRADLSQILNLVNIPSAPACLWFLNFPLTIILLIWGGVGVEIVEA